MQDQRQGVSLEEASEGVREYVARRLPEAIALEGFTG